MQCILLWLKSLPFNHNLMHCIGLWLKFKSILIRLYVPLTKQISNYCLLWKGIFKESFRILKNVKNIGNLAIFFPLFMMPGGGSASECLKSGLCSELDGFFVAIMKMKFATSLYIRAIFFQENYFLIFFFWIFSS